MLRIPGRRGSMSRGRTLTPMCGIAGIIRVQSVGEAPPAEHGIAESWLDLLDASVMHRGPDGHGRYRARAVRADGAVVDAALVHRRLSILDHAGGHQPMVLRGGGGAARDSETGPRGADAAAYDETSAKALGACPACAGTGDTAVAFNGCIYNHRELRAELAGLRHAFTSDHSDTEVLVHGWRQWGPNLFDRLVGMYALAIWDGRSGDLILARDRFGEKPLYGATVQVGDASIVAWASSCAGLWRWLRAMDADIGGEHLLAGLEPWVRFGFGPSPPGSWLRTIPPGASLVLTERSETYHFHGWRVDDDTPRPPERGEQLSRQQATSLLTRAVEARLESDVPLGCFLSGGVDSSLIAAIARRKLGSLRTFTVRMPDDRYDESAHAQRVAEALGTDHATLDCETKPSEDLTRLIGQLGLPCGDSSLLPTHWVSSAARRHVTVALSGDGADEMFIGYDRTIAADRIGVTLKMLPKGSFRFMPESLLPLRDPRSTWSRVARYVESIDGLGYLDLVSVFPDRVMRRLAPGLAARHAPIYGLPYAVEWDVMNYLPDDLLRKTDTASMASALEVRCPFLDPVLAHACLAAPTSDLLLGGRRKGLLREIARELAPGCDADRPKQGFAIPIGEWFRTDHGGMRALLMDHLTGPEPFGPDWLGVSAVIDRKYVASLLRQHDAAGATSPWPWKGRDHSQRLHVLLVLSIWAKGLAQM